MNSSTMNNSKPSDRARHAALWLPLVFAFALSSSLANAQDQPRQWSDSTGNFKIVATLIEVNNDVVFLKSTDGKTLKIPLNRLSQADQTFLKSADNPFSEVEPSGTSMPNNSAKPQATNTPGTTPGTTPSVPASGFGAWDSDAPINWESVEELDRGFGGDWKLELPKQGELSFTPKRATLTKKADFREDIRRLEINPIAQRAVVGYTVGAFFEKKPQSRLSLIDLNSGKAIHTGQIEGDMCPMCLLNDGSTVLMYGTSREKAYEQNHQIQLWKVNGKSVARSKLWIPFPNDSESFGKKSHGSMANAFPMANNRLILQAANGHVVCLDVVTRAPYWHTRFSDNSALDASVDGTLLAVFDSHSIMIVDPKEGKVVCTKPLADKPHVGWPRVRWSPSGKRLLISFMNQIRVLDLETGEWTIQCTMPGNNVVAANDITYPDDDFALVDNRLLIHLPTQIKVCEYRDAPRIVAVGGTSFIGIQANEAGLVVPSKIPHPKASETLAQAQKDPSVFLIHPGVAVSIDAGGAGQWSSQVAQALEQAAQKAGYKVTPGAPISIVASITGPKSEAVSFIARGSYVMEAYQSSLKLSWQGKDLWSTGGSNVPHFLQTAQGETIQEKLDKLSKAPNLSVFERAEFPKLLQRPSDESQPGMRSEALLLSKFTLQGLVDSK